MPVPAYDQTNWTMRGGTPTEGGWNQPTSPRREDRGHYDALARYEAGRRASHVEQDRFRPSFADERRMQQGSPTTPPPNSAYEDRSQSQQSRNPPAQSTLYSPGMGYTQRSPPTAQPRANLSRTRRRCDLHRTFPLPHSPIGAKCPHCHIGHKCDDRTPPCPLWTRCIS